MSVHNHGTEDGPGLNCTERVLPGGRRMGACLEPSHAKNLHTFRQIARALGDQTESSVPLHGRAWGASAHDVDRLMEMASDKEAGR